MTEDPVLAYVKASAVMLGLTLDDSRTKAVATHLARTAHLAELLERTPLAADDELAEIYKPMDFPLSDPQADAQ